MKNSRIFLSAPHMCGDELELVKEAFASNYIAPLGPQVDAFEKEFARKMGAKYATALSSGTAALHLVLRYAGVYSFNGNKIITTSVDSLADLFDD